MRHTLIQIHGPVRRRAPTHIPWRTSIKQSTLSAQRRMPHWRLNSNTRAIQVSATVKSVGRSSTPPLKREVLLQMPARQMGKGRLDTILYELDAGIRSRALPENA